MPRDVQQIAPGVVSELIVENGVAHWQTRNAGRKAHLEYLAELRKNPDALDHLSFAGWELSFPDISELALWKKRIPDLDSEDRQTRNRAWKWFMKSEHSDPYRVRGRKRGILTN
jgi:hypothetical protein